jgi:hypothetical protein
MVLSTRTDLGYWIQGAVSIVNHHTPHLTHTHNNLFNNSNTLNVVFPTLALLLLLGIPTLVSRDTE